jgi:hypothetical protein
MTSSLDNNEATDKSDAVTFTNVVRLKAIKGINSNSIEGNHIRMLLFDP